MLRLLVDATPGPSTKKDSVKQLSHEIWIKRIILPTFKLSAANHRRWTALFLKRYGFTLSADDLPMVPLDPRVLFDSFLTYPKLFPSSTFETMKDVVKINTFPSPDIDVVNTTIRGCSELLHSNAGNHWLSVWSTAENPFPLGLSRLADFMLERSVNEPSDGSENSAINTMQRIIMDMAKMYISMPDAFAYNKFIDILGFHRRIYSPESHDLFKSNCIPILEDCISYINSLRTPEWQRNPTRQPQSLPNTFAIKLQILQGRYWRGHYDTLSSADIQEYTLKQAVREQFHCRHFVSLALEFGSLESLDVLHRGSLDCLRFELVETLLSDAEDPEDDNLVDELGRFLKKWRYDPSEFIRTKVESILVMLYDR
ncbi:hypothetical protein F4804DRAFT_345106 [Jackrogersella minutella]|nr:hypothetical protein F4804DRAFT_345106 [Jackrogersella minutella]